MAMLAAIGDWLGGSGWTSVMTTAGEGRALGLQKSSHTSRAQWAHQVSVADPRGRSSPPPLNLGGKPPKPWAPPPPSYRSWIRH